MKPTEGKPMNARKLFAASLALMLVLALPACGSAPTEDPEAEPADVIESVELTEDDEAEEQTEATEEPEETSSSTQRIGTPEYGYVDVPADYSLFADVEGGSDLQYSDAAGTSIFTLNVFDLESVPEDMRESFTLYDAAQAIFANIDQTEPEDIEGATVELVGRTAYQVYAYYEDGTFLVAWVVDDPDGTIHYVAVEGPDGTILDNVGLVEATYAFDA